MANSVQFKGCNQTFVGPPGRDDVAPLPSFTNGKCVVSCWELTPDEYDEVVKTGKVYLATLGQRPAPALVGGRNTIRRVVQDYGGGF